jgi:RNA polymerase sigma factor (sigma-70 family)
MPRRSPNALVHACRRGDAAAWDEVLDRYGRLIWSVALRLGARSEEAEEIFQRTWVAVVEGIHQLRDPDRLASWVAGTTRYQTYRLFAEQGRSRRFASLEEKQEQGLEPSTTPDYDTDLDRVDRQAALRDALDRLAERCRTLIELLFFAEPPLDYQAIAERTGLAVGSIGPIRARCLARLERILHDLYHGPGEHDR